MSITLILSETERITINGRLAAIVRKLLLAREDIGEKGSKQVIVHCGQDSDQVKIEVPKVF